MGQSKHAPGPWEWDVWNIYSEGTALAEIYCDTEHCVDPREDAEAAANARLIAAAPELLEALRDLRACIWETRGPDAHDAVERADAAIAKAEGSQ